MVTVTLHPDIRHWWLFAPELRKTSNTGPDTGLHARLGSGPTTLRELLEVPCWISSRGKRLHSYRHRRRLYSWRHSHRDGVALARYGGETTVRSTGEEVTIHPWATFLETRRLGRLALLPRLLLRPRHSAWRGTPTRRRTWTGWSWTSISSPRAGRCPISERATGTGGSGTEGCWLPHFQLHFGERRPHPGPPGGVG